ncbi:MAG: homocysteine S-methyltransferase family protein [Geminicoccaceae bacterium]
MTVVGEAWALPQFGPELFMCDGGLETTLVYEQGIELPEFTAFPLVQTESGRAVLRRYLDPYVAVARERGVGLLLNTPTWRAHGAWGERLGYDPDALAAANRDACRFLLALRDELAGSVRLVIGGCIGPRGDGYAVGQRMTPEAAADYHAPQIAALREGGANFIAAMTLTYAEEAIGAVRAAQKQGIAAVVSFTVETDGRLPSGESLREAVEQVDAATEGAPAYFMVNCAHPSHVAPAFAEGGAWLGRVRGYRANASARSHAELDASTSLDRGDQQDLARRCADLRRHLPQLTIVGGCCGTDHETVAAIVDACLG